MISKTQLISKVSVSAVACLFLHATLAPRLICYAQETPVNSDTAEETEDQEAAVVTLDLGEPAPFAGTLFSVAAAARLLANLESARASCDLEVSRRVRLAEANMQLQIDTERARFEALEYRHNELMEIRDDQVNFLLENRSPEEWYHSNEFWFAIGSVVGVLVVIAGGYALSLVD